MHTDWIKVLAWPGYRVYQSHIDEPRRLLTLRVRRKRGNRKLTCSQCGRCVHEIRAVAQVPHRREMSGLGKGRCFEDAAAVVGLWLNGRCDEGLVDSTAEALAAMWVQACPAVPLPHECSTTVHFCAAFDRWFTKTEAWHAPNSKSETH